MKSIAIQHPHPNNDNRLKVEWNLSKRCNFDCSYCSPHTHDNHSLWKKLDDYKKAVDKLVKCTDKEIWLSFTGGEPCIYPNFLDLISHCKEKGIHYISVCSNGSMGAHYYVKALRWLDNIIISYHFEHEINVLDTILTIKRHLKNETMHVHVMMLPDHFDKSIEVMKTLKQNDVLFGVRRIRPLYMPDGIVARPHQKGGNLKLTENGPDYSDDQDYYSKEELEFFRRDLHEYI